MSSTDMEKYFEELFVSEAQTIKSTLRRKYLLDKINELTSIFLELWGTLSPEHSLITIQVTMDSLDSIFSARVLVIHGHYVQANMLLRTALESWLLGLYYEDHPVEWERIVEEMKKEKVPIFSSQLIEYFFKFEEFKAFQDRNPRFKEDIVNFYSDLSSYVHAVGIQKTNIKNLKRIEKNKYTMFSQKEIEQFVSNLQHLMNYLIIFTFLRYYSYLKRYRKRIPKLISALTPSYVQTLLELNKKFALFTYRTKIELLRLLAEKNIIVAGDVFD